MADRNDRLDYQKGVRASYEKARKWILATQQVCGICGQPVDKKLPPSDPMAPVVDHIVPVSKGGHPFDKDNLQLAHRRCNAYKSSKLTREKVQPQAEKCEIPDWAFLGSPQARESAKQGLPWSQDWNNVADIMDNGEDHL